MLFAYKADLAFGRIDKPALRVIRKVLFVVFKCNECFAPCKAFHAVCNAELTGYMFFASKSMLALVLSDDFLYVAVILSASNF